jgi:hypothetical protein
MSTKRNLVDEAEAAHEAGDYHSGLAIEIERMEALHAAGKAVDPKYVGREMLAKIEMLKACDLAMWQMKESLGYPIPYSVDERYPRKLAGCCGDNPFKCGRCEARIKYPDANLKVDAERAGGMYIPPKDFIKA